MKKRKIVKEDGRYLIFYRFDQGADNQLNKEAPVEASEGGSPCGCGRQKAPAKGQTDSSSCRGGETNV